MKKKPQFQHKLPTNAEAEEFELLIDQLNSVIIEMKEFAKKSPNDLLNKVKIVIINRLLERVKKLFDGQPQSDFLDLINEDDPPSNSDVVLIMGQYKAAMDNYKSTYFYYDSDLLDSRWSTEEDPIKGRYGN